MSMRASVSGESAPLLVSYADAKLGREAGAAKRRLPAVLTCAAVGFLVALVCFSLAGLDVGPQGEVAHFGFTPDDKTMEAIQALKAQQAYDAIDEGDAMTKDEYEARMNESGDDEVEGDEQVSEGDDSDSSASQLGWVPDEDFMEESERLYNQIPVGGLTQLDYESGFVENDDGTDHKWEEAKAATSGNGNDGNGNVGSKPADNTQNAQPAQSNSDDDYDGIKPASRDANLVGVSKQLNMGATSQPRERLRSPNPTRAKTLQFNPCAEPEKQEHQWSSANLRTECVVNANKCNFCAWVLQYDAEYRVNDIVSLLGPNYKVSSQSLLSRPEYQGTILRDMLDQKPKWNADDGSQKIQWKPNDRQEAMDNFNFIKNAVERMECRATASDTLLVHLRAGDAVGSEYKEIPNVDAAAQRVVEYAKQKEGVTKIEISGVLHFGVPDPDDAFYQNSGFEVMKDSNGEPRYRVTDDILKKNGYIVNKFIAAARDADLEVWFTSNNNPDTDMCRFAKACHFLSASRVNGKPSLGDATSRMSFSDLLDDLHWNLRKCD